MNAGEIIGLVMICIGLALAIFQIGWYRGRQAGIAEGKYLEAQRHAFFYRRREGAE